MVCIEGIREMAKKSLAPAGVTRKSESDTLFARLYALYAPWPSPGRYPPSTIVIERARVWRGQRSPDGKLLGEVIEKLAGRSLAREGVWFLIGLCESSFRSLRAVELALEPLFPDLLHTRSHEWPPSATARELLKSDFRQQWKEKVQSHGQGWWLAAGPTPLPIRHRPGLIAPWVAGVAVKRWLLLEKMPQDQANDLALQLAAALLDQKIHLNELQHWQDLVERITLSSEDGELLLPAYLVQHARAYVSQQTPIDMLTPTEFLRVCPIPLSVCDQFREIIQRAWSLRTIRLRRLAPQALPPQTRTIDEPFSDPSPTEEEQTQDESQDRGVKVACSLCNEKRGPREIFDHLWEAHGVPKDQTDIQAGHKRIRRKITGETLATWSEQ